MQLKEIKARVKYNLLCLFGRDGSWSMGASLTGNIIPFCGFWVNQCGTFQTYEEALRAAKKGKPKKKKRPSRCYDCNGKLVWSRTKRGRAIARCENCGWLYSIKRKIEK